MVWYPNYLWNKWKKNVISIQAQANEDICAEVHMLQPSKTAFSSLAGVMAAQKSLTNSLSPVFKTVSTHTPDIRNLW
jgi:hypothetical protein